MQNDDSRKYDKWMENLPSPWTNLRVPQTHPVIFFILNLQMMTMEIYVERKKNMQKNIFDFFLFICRLRAVQDWLDLMFMQSMKNYSSTSVMLLLRHKRFFIYVTLWMFMMRAKLESDIFKKETKIIKTVSLEWGKWDMWKSNFIVNGQRIARN